MRQSGLISLPSQRTLRDYTHYTSTAIGFSDKVDQQLMDLADISFLSTYQRCVAVIMDEMHIREGLVYDKHSGALLGSTDLGDVNNLLMKFERSLKSDAAIESLSKSMLVLMVRGLLCWYSWYVAYSLVSSFPMPSLRAHRLLETSSSALSGKEYGGLNGVASLWLLQQLMELHQITHSCAFTVLWAATPFHTRCSIPSPARSVTFISYLTHPTC